MIFFFGSIIVFASVQAYGDSLAIVCLLRTEVCSSLFMADSERGAAAFSHGTI